MYRYSKFLRGKKKKAKMSVFNPKRNWPTF